MKTRILAVVTILAVMFTAVPAFAGRPYAPRRVVHRHAWAVPIEVPAVPRVYRHYHPPVYVAPRMVPSYVVPRPGYWVPGRYYYDDADLRIGVHRGGFGLHIDF